jgi:hypothetical protein
MVGVCVCVRLINPGAVMEWTFELGTQTRRGLVVHLLRGWRSTELCSVLSYVACNGNPVAGQLLCVLPVQPCMSACRLVQSVVSEDKWLAG